MEEAINLEWKKYRREPAVDPYQNKYSLNNSRKGTKSPPNYMEYLQSNNAAFDLTVKFVRNKSTSDINNNENTGANRLNNIVSSLPTDSDYSTTPRPSGLDCSVVAESRSAGLDTIGSLRAWVEGGSEGLNFSKNNKLSTSKIQPTMNAPDIVYRPAYSSASNIDDFKRQICSGRKVSADMSVCDRSLQNTYEKKIINYEESKDSVTINFLPKSNNPGSILPANDYARVKASTAGTFVPHNWTRDGADLFHSAVSKPTSVTKHNRAEVRPPPGLIMIETLKEEDMLEWNNNNKNYQRNMIKDQPRESEIIGSPTVSASANTTKLTRTRPVVLESAFDLRHDVPHVRSSTKSRTKKLKLANACGNHPLTRKGQIEEAKICQICVDTASGFHYGVWTCEGCKAFFKRSLQKPIRYLCPGNNSCTIDRIRRKSCQACRLRRCYDAGMGLNYSQNNHIGRPRKKRGPSAPRSRAENFKTKDSTTAQPDKKKEITSDRELYSSPAMEITSNLSRTDSGSISTSESKTGLIGHRILDHLLSIEPVVEADSGLSIVTSCRKLLVTSLVDVVHSQLLNVIEWAKEIPEFDTLEILDRSNILANCWADMIIMGAVGRSSGHCNAIVLSHDFTLTRKCCEVSGLLYLYDRIMPLVRSFQRLKVTHCEMILLRLTILLNADMALTEQHACLVKLRDDLNNTWAGTSSSWAGTSRDSRTDMHRTARLLPLLAHIRHCSLTFLGLLHEIRKDRVIPIPELLDEMLDGDMETMMVARNILNIPHAPR